MCLTFVYWITFFRILTLLSVWLDWRETTWLRPMARSSRPTVSASSAKRSTTWTGWKVCGCACWGVVLVVQHYLLCECDCDRAVISQWSVFYCQCPSSVLQRRSSLMTSPNVISVTVWSSQVSFYHSFSFFFSFFLLISGSFIWLFSLWFKEHFAHLWLYIHVIGSHFSLSVITRWHKVCLLVITS